MTQRQITRRSLVSGAALAGAAAAFSGQAGAKGQHQDGHEGMGHRVHGGSGALGDTARACISAGQACLDHCLSLVQQGDSSIADCAAMVNLMIPMCDALARFSSAESQHLKDHAALCIKVCKDCEQECLKHADHHAPCKACADSCATCIKACEALLAA